jgi:NTP pyrophosphatase (non-canonical NTP hydrolase)
MIRQRSPQRKQGSATGNRMSLTLSQLHHLIRDLYGAKDQLRGVEGTFMWFMEEVGELATALRNGNKPERLTEFADVLAWLVTLANCVGIDLDEAVKTKYGQGCPGCLQIPCTCNPAEKP